jgi:hypothetical protein
MYVSCCKGEDCFYKNVVKVRLQVRVTSLGEFQPIERLFTLGGCLRITEVEQMFWLLLTVAQVIC